METDYVIIKVAFGSVEEAEKIANALVENNYVASAQLSPMKSIYIWKNEKCQTDEIELSCITRNDLFEKVKIFIKKHHSYECCQIISIPILGISKDFAKWVDKSTIIKSEMIQ